jgi:uncharacterized protein YjbI with pentapeptide repeats
MSEQDCTQAATVQRPAVDDREAWKAYWKAQWQEWRTEPEIDEKRQKFLAERRAIMPDIENGIFPFKNIKLSRADVEWLLATHENGRGPVDWSNMSERERQGLDARGADLRNVDLCLLPLARLQGGYDIEWGMSNLTLERFWDADIHLEDALLSKAHLEGAKLRGAHLERAVLDRAFLEEVDLSYARLEGASLPGSHLEGARLFATHFEKANLYMAHIEGTNLRAAHLDGTILERVFLADKKRISPLLADAEWGSGNLAVINWSQVKMLGDEYKVMQEQLNGEIKDRNATLEEFEKAVRANRQIAVALRIQGLEEEAARFAYRAQKLQRTVFRLQGKRKFVQYLFSLFLDILAGYGYKPIRCFIAYLLVIITFATIYFMIGQSVGPHLSPISAWVFSMTSFHGRGFFPGGIRLDDPLTVIAALEAFIGLLIEVTFIATLTQRLFGK